MFNGAWLTDFQYQQPISKDPVYDLEPGDDASSSTGVEMTVKLLVIKTKICDLDI